MSVQGLATQHLPHFAVYDRFGQSTSALPQPFKRDNYQLYGTTEPNLLL
jgi:hypothetical protein